MVASSVVSTILILNYHHRNADTHEMSDWVSPDNTETVAGVFIVCSLDTRHLILVTFWEDLGVSNVTRFKCLLEIFYQHYKIFNSILNKKCNDAKLE